MTISAERYKDTSRYSYYFDDAFQERAVAISTEWRTMAAIPADRWAPPENRLAAEALIALEQRLIDADRLEEWLDLYVPECLYWIPSEPDARDPRVTVTLEIHDRRRLEDRVARLRSGFAYSQLPPTRTRHLSTNIEVWTGDRGDLRARANFMVQGFRDGRYRVLSGWMGWNLVKRGGSWKIEIKQINLLDCDHPQENITFTL